MKRRLARALPPLRLALPAAVSGVLLTLCFPPFSVWPLVFVALAPMFAGLVLVRPGRRDSFKALFLFGLFYYGTLMWWLVFLLPSAGATMPWILVPALLILSSYLALYPALGFVLVAAVTRYRLLPFAVAAPAVWVLADLARSQGELSFSWGALGYALSDTPALIQSASLFGMPGLTFLAALTNVLVALAFVLRRSPLRWVSLAAAVFVVAGMWLHGQGPLERWTSARGEQATVRTAVVQPNIDLAIKWKPEFKDSTLNVIENLIRESVALDAKFIVFPETSAPVYIDGRNRSFKIRLRALAHELDSHVYLGFLNHRYTPDGELDIFNSSGVFSPDGVIDKYNKNHLLPFGEQLPLSWKFRWIRNIDFGQSNFMRGDPHPPIAAAGLKFTPLICFESVFPYLCRRGVRQGSQLLVNITNDGWFGDTPGPFQHAQMSILRAVEFRRYLLRSANSGVSMIVDPAGRVVTSLGLYQKGILTFNVPPLDGETLYCRYGDWLLFVWCVLLVVAAALARRRLKG